jgi:hypothetical protein
METSTRTPGDAREIDITLGSRFLEAVELAAEAPEVRSGLRVRPLGTDRSCLLPSDAFVVRSVLDATCGLAGVR